MMVNAVNTLGIACQVYSFDIDLTLIDDVVKKHQPENLNSSIVTAMLLLL